MNVCCLSEKLHGYDSALWPWNVSDIDNLHPSFVVNLRKLIGNTKTIAFSDNFSINMGLSVISMGYMQCSQLRDFSQVVTVFCL